MSKDNYIILGIHLDNRVQEAQDVQKLLTDYGCNIKTRIGLHEVNSEFCSQGGLILLELVGDSNKVSELETKLNGITGINVKKMVF